MESLDLQNAIIPVNVEDVLKGKHVGGSHTISVENITLDVVNVVLCGLLTRSEDKLDQPWYTLDDASGKINIAHTIGQEEVTQCGSARVIGNIRTDANGAFYIQAVTINPSNDINVLSCHLLERKMAIKLYTKGLPPALRQQHGMSDIQLPLSGPTIKNMPQSGNDKETVLDFIKITGSASFSAMQNKFPNLNLDKLIVELEQEDGLIFDATDEGQDDRVFQSV